MWLKNRRRICLGGADLACSLKLLDTFQLSFCDSCDKLCGVLVAFVELRADVPKGGEQRTRAFGGKIGGALLP